MKRWSFSVMVTWALFGSNVIAKPNMDVVALHAKSRHSDYRRTIKHLANLDYQAPTHLSSAEEIATEYLQTHSGLFGLIQGLKDLKIYKVKKSLLGEHVYFQQYFEGVPIDTAEIIVSVNVKHKSVYQLFNNYYPVPAEKHKSTLRNRLMQADQAFDIAWEDLHVSGKLLSAPKIHQTFVVENGVPRPVYVTFLKVESPFGAWRHTIDARTGKILERLDTRIERIKQVKGAKPSKVASSSAMVVRQRAFAEYAAKQLKADMFSDKHLSQPAVFGEGSGFVFDPDPKTVLANSGLIDTSPEMDLDAAYEKRTLQELTVVDGVYKLEGPWVKIGDFEFPNTAPSTSTTGAWEAKRGNNAFNDVMTYYHLDASQRYMQSLGFKDDRSIQGAPIEADADGVGGQDNSHFISETNQLAFGHGCVDDNEDADVILHEYGHAINFSINSNWLGGDTGAMGEGFGDYWAASYSYAHANGKTFEVGGVFNWDGGPCWPGRRTDALTLTYDHEQMYGPHFPLDDFSTDELWSTPLFQALVELTNLGIPREQVDTVILEAQFGLGANLKMRDLANAIILTARRLYPEGPHADVFKTKFMHHEIIETPRARLFAKEALHILNPGNNGVIDPGETLDVEIAIENQGNVPAQGVSATLTTSTEKVTITTGTAVYADIEPAAVQKNTSPFQFTVGEDFVCGEAIDLKLDLAFAGGAASSAVMEFSLPTGTPVGAKVSTDANLAIPDNNTTGIASELKVETEGSVSENFSVDLEITHTYIGDLEVILESPKGTKVALHARTGGGSRNIVGNYPESLTPNQSLAALKDEPINGVWKLHVLDRAGSDLGTLVRWGIKDITGYECD